MIAVNLLYDKTYQALKVDEVILKFFNRSDYYIDYGKYIAILTKTSVKENKIDYGHRYMYFRIGTELYESCFTNSLIELNKMSKLLDSNKTITKPVQLNFNL